MINDDQDRGSQDAQPEELTQIVHELAEALTALGNYVAAAAQISNGGKATSGDIRKALEAGLIQHESASIGLRRLRKLVMRRKRT